EVEGVKSIMSQNVERILARGENLEHLRNKTEDLEATVRGHCGDTGDIAGTRVCGSRGGGVPGSLVPKVAPRSPRGPGCVWGNWVLKVAPGPQMWAMRSSRWHWVPMGSLNVWDRVPKATPGPQGVLKIGASGPHR
uniref:V-SNARE coiled-coil homology domain-containing protein n=1 Tax=Cairina moschata TaxID=8855 RepID=A0A8C3CET8_CAIMO